MIGKPNNVQNKGLPAEKIHPDVLEVMRSKGVEPPSQFIIDIGEMLMREIPNIQSILAFEKDYDAALKEMKSKGYISVLELEYAYADKQKMALDELRKARFKRNLFVWVTHGAISLFAAAAVADKTSPGTFYKDPKAIIQSLEVYFTPDELKHTYKYAKSEKLVADTAQLERERSLKDLSEVKLNDSMIAFFYPESENYDRNKPINFVGILTHELEEYSHKVATKRVMERIEKDASFDRLLSQYRSADRSSEEFAALKKMIDALIDTENHIVKRELSLDSVLEKFQAMRQLPAEAFDGSVTIDTLRRDIALVRKELFTSVNEQGKTLVTAISEKYSLRPEQIASLQSSLDALSADTLLQQMIYNCVSEGMSTADKEKVFTFMLQLGGKYFLAQLPPLDPSLGQHRLLPSSEPELIENGARLSNRTTMTIEKIVHNYLRVSAETIAQGLSKVPILEEKKTEEFINKFDEINNSMQESAAELEARLKSTNDPNTSTHTVEKSTEEEK
jgi:hypothetical protein